MHAQQQFGICPIGGWILIRDAVPQTTQYPSVFWELYIYDSNDLASFREETVITQVTCDVFFQH